MNVFIFLEFNLDQDTKIKKGAERLLLLKTNLFNETIQMLKKLLYNKFNMLNKAELVSNS